MPKSFIFKSYFLPVMQKHMWKLQQMFYFSVKIWSSQILFPLLNEILWFVGKHEMLGRKIIKKITPPPSNPFTKILRCIWALFYFILSKDRVVMSIPKLMRKSSMWVDPMLNGSASVCLFLLLSLLYSCQWQWKPSNNNIF